MVPWSATVQSFGTVSNQFPVLEQAQQRSCSAGNHDPCTPSHYSLAYIQLVSETDSLCSQHPVLGPDLTFFKVQAPNNLRPPTKIEKIKIEMPGSIPTPQPSGCRACVQRKQRGSMSLILYLSSHPSEIDVHRTRARAGLLVLPLVCAAHLPSLGDRIGGGWLIYSISRGKDKNKEAHGTRAINKTRGFQEVFPSRANIILHLEPL